MVKNSMCGSFQKKIPKPICSKKAGRTRLCSVT
jgi:hypothetical protein